MFFKNKILLNELACMWTIWKESNQKQEHNLVQHSSVFKVLRWPSYYLNVTDPLLISMILIFWSCREKAHDNEGFSRENSKPRRESRITTH